jgi:hypothetical protein
LIVAVSAIGHPTRQNTFKNLIPEFPGTLLGAAVFNCQQGLMVGLTTADPTMALGRLQGVVIPLKLIRAVLGEKGFMLMGSTWLGH